MKQRDFRIDLLRAFACIMVLFCHAPQKFLGQGGKFLVGIDNYFGMAWGPILFFAISGACILGQEREAIPFLKKRFARILAPTVIWSVIYIVLGCYVWKTVPSEDFLSMLPKVLVSPQYGLMWFMYALVAIYLATPILSRWLSVCSQKEIRLYLELWGITLCLPYISLLGFDATALVGGNGMLQYMSGFLWCAVAGYYCRSYVRISWHNVWYILMSLIILISPVYVFILKRFYGGGYGGSTTLFSMATTLFAMVFVYSVSVKKLEDSNVCRTAVNSISKLSFGIYLSHMIFLYPFNEWISTLNLNYAIQLPLTVFVIGVVSYCFTWILAKLPYSKYLIG